MVALKSKKVRALVITGMVKPSGNIAAKAINDKGDVYFVQVRANGTTSCKSSTGEECKGHKFTGHCYHVDAVKMMSFPTYEQLAYPSIGGHLLTANEQVRANIEAAACAGDRSYSEVLGYAPAEVINPRTGMTDAKYQEYQNYLMGIGA